MIYIWLLSGLWCHNPMLAIPYGLNIVIIYSCTGKFHNIAISVFMSLPTLLLIRAISQFHFHNIVPENGLLLKFYFDRDLRQCSILFYKKPG